MSTGVTIYRDKAYKKPRSYACKWCKCFLKSGTMCMVAMRYHNNSLRNYCSSACYFNHLEEIRAGAAERVAAFKAKKGIL